MGFRSGVVAGVALAAGAAAWFMSRSGERFRDQYRVDRKLGELGDQLEARTREIQSTLNAQVAEIRANHLEAADAQTTRTAPKLDAAQASAAEAAAELAADVEARAAKVKKAAKDAADAASE